MVDSATVRTRVNARNRRSGARCTTGNSTTLPSISISSQAFEGIRRRSATHKTSSGDKASRKTNPISRNTTMPEG